jgi:hypothetical protein
MTSAFPAAPVLLKGGLVVYEVGTVTVRATIVFQYNPEQVSRRLEQPGRDGDPWLNAGDTQFVLPPTETFDLTVELDAADQLEESDSVAVSTGLHPSLAELELLLYPSSDEIILSKTLAAAGGAYATPPQAPIVLLVWGPLRVVPVRVESVSISEEAFDQLLNPIRAKVELSLRTLTDKELDAAGAPFAGLGLVNLESKEALAAARTFQQAEAVVGAATAFVRSAL